MQRKIKNGKLSSKKPRKNVDKFESRKKRLKKIKINEEIEELVVEEAIEDINNLDLKNIKL